MKWSREIMVLSYTNGVPAPKLEEYDEPVLHSPSSDGVYHLPQIEGDKAVFTCGTMKGKCRVSELSIFKRRRGARVCKVCSWRNGDVA